MKYKNREDFLSIIDNLKLKNGCEIGVYKGDYSIKILEKTNLDKLYLIDPWKHLDNYKDISNHNDNDFKVILEEVKNKTHKFKDRVEIIQDLSENVNSDFKDNYFDFIYLDANHSYEASKKDIELWYSKVRPGGIFSGHDYLNGILPQGEFGVKQAIDEFSKKNNLKIHTTGEDEWKSWYIIKPINIVLYCTKNYLDNSLYLIKTLNSFHDNLIFYLYTLNFEYKCDIKNVNIIKIQDERITTNMKFKGNANDNDNKNMFMSIFFKSRVMLDSITNLKLSNAIYMDSDILPTGNINSLFNYFDKITNYPLIQEGLFEYQINFGRGNPFKDNGFDETNILEYPLMNKLSIPIKNRTKYSNASIELYNKTCKEFLEEYDKLNNEAYNLSISDINFYYPFTDETSINVLLWKYQYNNRLPFLQMNIDNIDNIKEFYESNYDNEKQITGFVRVPSKEKKKDILFFHGVKGEVSKETFNTLNNMFKYNLNIKENKITLTTKLDFNRNLKVSICDINDDIIYETSTIFNKNVEYWYAPSNKLEKFEEIIVKVYDNEKLIFKKTIINDNCLFLRNNILVKKPALLIHSNCYGDTLNTTPLIRTLSNAYGCKIDIFTYLPELFINSPYIDKIYSVNEVSNSKHELYEIGKSMLNNYHKQIRKTHLVDFFTIDLGFTLTSEEKQLDFFPDPWQNKFELPEKYICINPSITWPSKSWKLENWQELISKIDMKIVVLGKKVVHLENDIKSFSILKNDNIIDLTEKTTLSDAWYIINNAESFITFDSGLLHLAGTTDTHIIQLGSYIHPLSKTPFRKGSQTYKYTFIGGVCKLFCASDLKYSVDVVQSLQNYPIGKQCLEKYSEYRCHPTPEQVFDEIN